MKLGMIGLGRMGSNMARRIMRAGHHVVAYDPNPNAVQALAAEGAEPASTLSELAAALEPPRAVWLMVPAAITDNVLRETAALLEPGDILVDGGNSYFRDDRRRAAELKERGLHYIDVGTSGGVWGLERGYCLMIGGEKEPVSHLEPIFKALAPGPGTIPRTPGRESLPGTAEHGYLHCGPAGAGHFVKMIHNGIEYGIMAAIAEGFDILAHANIALHPREADAETAPLMNPDLVYDINLADVAELWRRGSVISSWLLDLTAAALAEDPELSRFTGSVSDSGEGRWTVMTAIDEGVQCNVLSAALYARFRSRKEHTIAEKICSAMRFQFGGHQEKPRA